MRCVLHGLLWGISASVIAACSSARHEGLDRSRLPEEVRADYDVFARRCSKCHTLARPLQSNITDDQQWVMYVNRMRRQPGSGITYDDQERILRFLRYYAAETRRREAEKNGVTQAPASSPASAPTDTTPPPPVAPTTAPPPGDR